MTKYNVVILNTDEQSKTSVFKCDRLSDVKDILYMSLCEKRDDEEWSDSECRAQIELNLDFDDLGVCKYPRVDSSDDVMAVVVRNK